MKAEKGVYCLYCEVAFSRRLSGMYAVSTEGCFIFIVSYLYCFVFSNRRVYIGSADISFESLFIGIKDLVVQFVYTDPAQLVEFYQG